jgi:hypothetical protein
MVRYMTLARTLTLTLTLLLILTLTLTPDPSHDPTSNSYPISNPRSGEVEHLRAIVITPEADSEKILVISIFKFMIDKVSK